MRREVIEAFLDGNTLKEGPKETVSIMLPILQADIDNGVPGNPQLCAVACGGTRVFGPRSRGILTYQDIAYIDTGTGELWRMRMDAPTRRAIAAFDANSADVEPFTAKFYPVGESQTTRAKTKANRKRRAGKPRTVSSPRPRAHFSYRGAGLGLRQTVHGDLVPA